MSHASAQQPRSRERSHRPRYKARVAGVTTALWDLTNATGTTSSFTVPTQYRGDALATMHAAYADGSNAGQTSWNPFQEFNKAFDPDCPNGTIILTPEFLNALREGEPAALTFHFYGGATVTYHVTKSGSSVTGTLS